MQRLRKRKSPAVKEEEEEEEQSLTAQNVLSCSKCDKTYSRADTLRAHERAVHGKKALKCSVCLKVFSSSQALHRHTDTHIDERPHECSICGRTFQRKDSLTYHMHTVHTGVTDRERAQSKKDNIIIDSQCDFCLRYRCPRHHLIPVNKHKKLSTYHQCTVCLKITTCCQLHWSHQHLEHAETDVPIEEGYQCKRCRRLFTSHKALQRHCGGECHLLESAAPLFTSTNVISEASMESWMRKEKDKKYS